MDAPRNRGEGSVPGFDGRDSADAICRHLARTRDDREKCAAGRLPLGPTGHTKTGNLQSRRRLGNPRAVVRAEDGGTGATPGADFYSRRINPPNDSRLPLHGLLPQRLRDESVSGEPWVRGAVGQLSDGHYVWPALSRTERWRPTRRRRV